MKRFLAFVLAVCLITGATAGSVFYICTKLDKTQAAFATAERRSFEMHRAATEHRDRLDAENKASIADRQRIADQLRQIESAIQGEAPHP